MSENYEAELFEEVKQVFRTCINYENKHPLLPLNESLESLQQLILPSWSDESEVEDSAEQLKDEVGDFEPFPYIQTGGFGHCFLNGTDDQPSTIIDLDDKVQLAGYLWDAQMTDWPNYDSLWKSREGDMEFTPCLILKGTSLHDIQTGEKFSLEKFDVYVPLNSSKLTLAQVRYLDMIA